MGDWERKSSRVPWSKASVGGLAETFSLSMAITILIKLPYVKGGGSKLWIPAPVDTLKAYMYFELRTLLILTNNTCIN